MLIDEEPAARSKGAGTARVWAYRGAGQGVRAGVPLEEVSDLLDTPGTLVWIDLNDPEPEMLELLRGECRLHPLAIEDAQRPKVEAFCG